MEAKDSLTKQFFRTVRILHAVGGPEYSQQRVLRLLADGEMKQKDLQEQLNIKAGSLSELLTKLSSKGCIVKEKSDADRRVWVLKITDEGRKKAALFEETKDERLFAPLSEEERVQMKQMLARVLAYHTEEHV
ncbi:MAG: winged helix DNA-binding protein [Solobacterium sp.]|jgi:DNA-binding MarR family transcriptional regulator|nr:winged helix DNA-binding protein [Solobacterium sp.]